MKNMDQFSGRLMEIEARCKGDYCFTDEDRQFLHAAYWARDETAKSWVLQILCWEPDLLDMPVLLDGASLKAWWVTRCDAAQAFEGLGEVGRLALRDMLARETHSVARFYILRELIDLKDEICLPFLVGPVPSQRTPIKRETWIYGNFEQGKLNKEQALKYLECLMHDRKRRFEWLRNHIMAS